MCKANIKPCTDLTKLFCFLLTGFAYGHSNDFGHFIIGHPWLEAAYMKYAWPNYLSHQTHNAAGFPTGELSFDCLS